ncbi:MAG TPA: hypothetical protein VEF04_15850, partial [Blastocatellia bacterium]|nr:hypothetical protein [Blastocatellia bacterium]
LKKDEAAYFKQPCPAYQQNCCQVYADRPTNCQKYRCALLRKFDRGEISWDEAQQKIDRVRELKGKLKNEMVRIFPDAYQMSLPQILKAAPEQKELATNPAVLKTWGQPMLLLSALKDCIQQHFQPPSKENDSSIAVAQSPRAEGQHEVKASLGIHCHKPARAGKSKA